MTRANFPRYASAPIKLRTMYPGGPDNECWLWPYGKTSEGYGRIYDGVLRYVVSVHVASYSAFVKLPKPEHYILHKCDNPACWNPSHLFEGTQQVNLLDMQTKHRSNYAHGETHHKAKLTDQDVVTIRQLLSSGMKQRVIAKQYAVSQATISLIANKLRRA